MKKSLFALAAVTAFAGAAQAQSSVTVYGIIDMGIAGGNARSAGQGSTGQTVTKGTGLGIQQSPQTTSRLGFRGTEDLGGGTSAFFTVELALTPDATQVLSSSATSNRQTFVGLRQKGLGSFALGNQYTPIHEAVGRTDPGQQNNIVGSVIYTINGQQTVPQGSSSFPSSYGLGNGDSYTVRQANSLTLKSENISGFTARGFLSQKNSNTTQTATATGTTVGSGGQSNASGYGLGLDYAWKKLYLTANYQYFTDVDNAIAPGNATTAPRGATTGTVNSAGQATTTTATGFALTGDGQANTAGTNVNDKQIYVAATYDFGILRGFVNYIDRKATANNNSAFFQRYTAQQIGVRGNITKTIQAWASTGMGAYESYGNDMPSANVFGYQLGANYILSKRTNLYAIYGNASQSNAANSTNLNSTARNTSYNINNYAVGVRHTF
jgi:predicted porin